MSDFLFATSRVFFQVISFAIVLNSHFYACAFPAVVRTPVANEQFHGVHAADIVDVLTVAARGLNMADELDREQHSHLHRLVYVLRRFSDDTRPMSLNRGIIELQGRGHATTKLRFQSVFVDQMFASLPVLAR
jgi:hypothetical protein